MTSINIPRGDIGTLDLQLANASSLSVKPVKPVQAYPAVNEHNPIRQIVRDYLQGKGQRRKSDRRHDNRRNRNEPVLLDTRFNRDRRQHGRRQTDDSFESENERPLIIRKGFDGYA